MSEDTQSSNSALLVRPSAFGFHAEAAQSNAFAHQGADTEVAILAQREFDRLVQQLEYAGVEVLVLDDSPKPPKPDAVFPNNWVSFHSDGTIVVYPMATEARRLERNTDGLISLLSSSGFDVRQVVDLSFHERNGHFLEGTGSLILDRAQRRAFASLSPRTDDHVIADFDDRLDYSTLIFDAHDRSGKPIYHTNVLMSFGSGFAVICTEAVAEGYRRILIDEIEAGGRMHFRGRDRGETSAELRAGEWQERHPRGPRVPEPTEIRRRTRRRRLVAAEEPELTDHGPFAHRRDCHDALEDLRKMVIHRELLEWPRHRIVAAERREAASGEERTLETGE